MKRPWRNDGPIIDAEAIVTNELEELYNESVAKALPEMKRTCYACGLPMTGASRITDGELFWHIGCAGFGNILKSEAIA